MHAYRRIHFASGFCVVFLESVKKLVVKCKFPV